MNHKHIISISDLSKKDIIDILELATKFEKKQERNLLRGYVIATLFYEPSTRTRLSFESAAAKLGCGIIGFSDVTTSSVKKGESLKDTIKTVNNYADLVVIRHPKDGSARYASEVSNKPVINAGDGSNQHPTQTLLDLYSIKKTQKKLSNLKIAFVGDLKYGRTVHSLALAMSLFNCEYYFVSPKELKMPKEILLFLKSNGLNFIETTDLEKIIPKVDILYMTRIQKERFSDIYEYEKVKSSYILKKSMLLNSKKNLKILHPLPRVNEISTNVDDDSKAYYFEQMGNGIYVRQAILSMLLGVLKK